MDLYYRAGARYFVAQAMHHDNFFNYDSKIHPFNSVNIGPGKDICALWKAAADKHNMPFGLTEHLGASFSWWTTNKGSDSYGPYKGVPYDGNDPQYAQLYHANQEHVDPAKHGGPVQPWLTSQQGVPGQVAQRHEGAGGQVPSQPALLRQRPALRGGGRRLPARLGRCLPTCINDSIQVNGSNQAVYTQKDRRPEIYQVGVLDIEKSQLPGVQERPWQTDTCIGNWFYDAKQPYKHPDQIIEMLIDIVSKNGTMLLNVLQRPDGTIDDEARYILEELATWFPICGEAIYGTRPWRVFGEGDTRVTIDGFTENKTEWNSSDYRFTQKDGALYAFLMKAPESGVAVLKSLAPSEKVASVELLGAGPVEFVQSFGVLTVQLPEQLPTQYTNCLKIQFA